MSSDDLVRAAAAELYSADPDQFVERRGELAAQARGDGQAAAAKQITGMRKPTRSAWVINQLVRAQPEVITELASLGRELRAAQRTLDGPAIRELSRRRRELVGTLVRQAFRVAGLRAPAAALRDEVAATFGAALNDAQVANQLAEGTLVRAARSEGFGSTGPELTLVPSAAAGGSPSGSGGSRAKGGPSRPASGAADRRPAAARRSGKAALAAVPSAQPARPPEAEPAAGREPKAAPRARPAESAAARKKAEQQQRRDAIAAAERALAVADRAVVTASQAERDQEAAVLRMEEELADARRQLAETRLRARRARTGQRQARLAVDRLRRDRLSR